MISSTWRSAYDPATGICWAFGHAGERHSDKTHCPACAARGGLHRLAQSESAIFGRVRSGKRWFWAAALLMKPDSVYGWEDTEEAAIAAAVAAVPRLKTKPFMWAYFSPLEARDVLKRVNEAKRRARPAPDTSDARVTEYLYSRRGYKFRIIRKTAKRIFYSHRPISIEELADKRIKIQMNASLENVVGYIDRQKIERDGEAWSGRHWSSGRYLYLAPPPRQNGEAAPDLRELKAAMAAAHPDRGGSHDGFIAARARYLAALRAS